MSWTEMAKVAPLAGGHDRIANSFHEHFSDGGEPTEAHSWCQSDMAREVR